VNPRDAVALVALGALWGGSFLFIRVAVPSLGPLLLMELRVGIASLALVLFAGAVDRRPKLRARWRQFLLIGTLNAAIPSRS
jgi:drug/metabolite transporter (DMT)-like permease